MTKPDLLASCVLLTCLAGLAPDALAWSDAGHRLVCDIAYEWLDKPTRKTVDRLMTAVPAAEARRVNGTGRMRFSESCVWPDKIRDIDRYKRFAPWHYINVARDDDEVHTRQCGAGCVVDAIARHSAQLGDTRRSDVNRAEALMFLGHWVGDLHQPLHVSYGDDWGGNKVRVAGGDCDNLHGVWDYCIIATRSRGENQLRRELLRELSRSKVSAWQTGQPLDWAQESYDLVRSKSVGYCRQRGNRCDAIPGTRELSDGYLDEAWQIARRRIQQAGARLAGSLNQLLSP